MSVYNTKQRKILLNFLKSHSDELFSANQILEFYGDEKISLSAIYRNLAEIETLGEIKRVNKNSSREAFYQYINADICKGKIHLFCTKCEKSTHLDIKRAESFSEDIFAEQNFQVDKQNTIIYGICKDCR